MPDFITPNWSTPLDLDERLAKAPDDITVKGIFFRTARQAVLDAGGTPPGRKSYGILSNYPLEELLTVLAECAPLANPSIPPRESLYRIGQQLVPAIKGSTAGTFIFSVAAGQFTGALKLVTRIYETFSSTKNSAIIEMTGDRSALVKLRNVWTFPDCYHYGVFSGALPMYGLTGRVTLAQLSLCDTDIKVEWD